MPFFIWQDESYPLFDYASDRDVFNYPKHLLNIIKDMQSQDSKRRPKFKNIIEECFTYLRDMTDKNSIFHVDNLCLKYLNHRGIQGGNRGDNIFYKKDNEHIFTLMNYPQIILDHIERLYTDEPVVASPPRASPEPVVESPPFVTPPSSIASSSPRAPVVSTTPPFVTPDLIQPSAPTPREPVLPLSSPQTAFHITPPQSENCTTDKYEIYEVFSEINPDNHGEHIPNQEFR